MDRFETLFEKNVPEKGGSFYIQSKIYFAKEFLMQDFDQQLNTSAFNPGQAQTETSKPEPDQPETEKSELDK